MRVENRIRERVGGQRYSKRKTIAWGKIWPHGEFSLAWVKEPLEETSFQDEYSYLKEAAAPHCLLADRPPSELGGSPLLDSSSKFSQDTSRVESREKRKNGLKGITSFGRKMVQSGVTMLAKKHGQRKLTFATLTVPPLCPGERALLASKWGEVLRQLIQWVSRRLEKQGLPAEVCSVSEIQPKRLRKTGEGYLHAHLVWPNRLRHPSDYSVEVEDLRAFWQSLVGRAVNKDTLPIMQIRVETVKSNVAGYLAKYMSKGGEGLQQYRDDVGDEGVPGQWWNMSKPCRDMTKRAVLTGAKVGEFLEMVHGYFLDFQEDKFPGAVHACQKEWDGRIVTLAYYGWIESKTLDDWRAMLQT